MRKQAPATRPSPDEPLAPGIILDPVTSELSEPYCVLQMDDQGAISAMVYDHASYVITRTYWPGHADWRWAPTRVATTQQQARWLLAERPANLVAVIESVVQEMFRGQNLAFTSPNPQ